jgi:hypothetical protein
MRATSLNEVLPTLVSTLIIKGSLDCCSNRSYLIKGVCQEKYPDHDTDRFVVGRRRTTGPTRCQFLYHLSGCKLRRRRTIERLAGCRKAIFQHVCAAAENQVRAAWICYFWSRKVPS